MQEEFRDVEGYEGLYQVSNLGRVKSLPKEICNIKRCYTSKEKILKSGIEKHGYCLVVLFKNKNGKTNKVHKLVAMAFLNHKPCGHELVINHIDFNKSNNNLDNLEIVTQRENSNRKHLKSSSKYVGVSFDKGKWKAQIEINDKRIYLGRYNTELEASEVYQLKLKTL
jgi:hypothetical protein